MLMFCGIVLFFFPFMMCILTESQGLNAAAGGDHFAFVMAGRDQAFHPAFKAQAVDDKEF